MADSQLTFDDLKPPVEYRDIAGWPGYRVGNDGSVWTKRLSGGRMRREWHRMTGGIAKHGYTKISLCNNGKQTCKLVGRLVLEAFVGPCPEGMEMCHGIEGSTVDRIGNLRWDTHVSNMADKLLHGTAQRGEKSGLAILTSEQVIEICRRWDAGGITQMQLAAEFGVKNVTICAIVTGRNWSHLTGRSKTNAKAEVLITRRA